MVNDNKFPSLDFVNNVPTHFQIFIDNCLKGFISYTDEWTVDKYSLGNGILDEAMAQEIGDYLMAYYG